MGASGWVAGLVDAFPEETVAIYTYCKNSEIEKARSIFRWFLPLLELDISPQLVQNIKLCELATGLGTGFVRPPRLPLEGNEFKRGHGGLRNNLVNQSGFSYPYDTEGARVNPTILVSYF